MRVYLVGFMGAGKTTIGYQLARNLAMQFIDTDQQIAREQKMPVDVLFAKHGENFFRRAEQKVLHQTFKITQGIISTGGGTPCFFDNMQQMKKNGLIFYLKLPENYILYRLQNSAKERPLINGKDSEKLAETIKILFEKRQSFYEQAHFAVDAANKNALHYISRILSGYMY